ncbi:MAG: sugar isomerase [Flavobacterium sp. BFFFF1]|uniref:oligosaccharide flippase family protein n=1 Tax=Flavobacterium sp. BFFFF1 TaxID=2015557 RepID=UPI000BCA9031|nr:oligosaccharide flippase family protein [Flavobacterium sp. BFFFF1]OYU79741.1 MAG: sugar isomerase [Flavobacterium sp. BFFFF1]
MTTTGTLRRIRSKQISEEQFFLFTMLLVNGGNYIYNLLLGRILGPEAFADAAILITFLLVLSFLGMAFQIVTSKYAVLLEKDQLDVFIAGISKVTIGIGIAIGAAIMIFSHELQLLFHTKTSAMFVVFGFGIPLYLLMSVNRGLYQGKDRLAKMAITYQTEMISRLAITLLVVSLFPSLPTSVAIAAGIVVSFVFGLLPFQKNLFKKPEILKETINTKSIIRFFALTACYECVQIIINNSDVLLVKHYFSNHDAGLYSSLALIGRVVYFVAWMFVMLLLPKVIQRQKQGLDTKSVLMKYVGYISLLSTSIVAGSCLFPETVVRLMFGNDYLAIAPLLWKYALATSVFAVANIFAYYFLSLGKYIPVLFSGIMGLTQIALIVMFHKSLQQTVEMQIIAMFGLLFIQLAYFLYHTNKNIRLT